MDYKYISPDKISEVLFDEPEHIIEFCEAGLSSFGEFKEHFGTRLVNRNMEGLRKAGHKIKPGAKIMGADIVVDEYEKAKTILDNGDASDKKLEATAQNMTDICSSIEDELKQLAKSLA